MTFHGSLWLSRRANAALAYCARLGIRRDARYGNSRFGLEKNAGGDGFKRGGGWQMRVGSAGFQGLVEFAGSVASRLN